MFKLFLLSAVLLAGLSIPATAAALDTKQDYSVVIYKGNKDYDVGTIYLSLEDSDSKYCYYYGEWENEYGSISTDCEVRERKTIGHKSCLSNSKKGFATIVSLGGGCECEGFDTYGLKREVVVLVLSEDTSSDLGGLIQMDGLDVQAIELTGY